MLRKTMVRLAAAGALCAASAAGAQVTINFDSPGNTNPGTSASFGSPSVTATGYDCTGLPCATTDLYIKNAGPGEQGLGLNNDPANQHELWGPPGEAGTPFIQLDVSGLLGLTNGASFTMNSVTNGEWWEVYGATGAGGGGAMLLGFGNDELSHNFLDWGTFSYYDFVSLGTLPLGQTPDTCHEGCTRTEGNVLLSSLTYTPSVPEPASWAMMLIGFGAVGAAMRRGKRKQIAQVA